MQNTFNEVKDSKEIKYHDLTGPLDYLYASICINEDTCNAVDIDAEAITWVTSFTSIYQAKDVTPYVHALAMHMEEFIQLHGSVVKFTQQGLEKLNDLTTKHFQRATNHHESQSLLQILEKGYALKH